MNRNNIELLDDSIKALRNCSDALTKISETCCMPGRSPDMKEAHLLLEDVISSAKETYNDRQHAHKCIEGIGIFGSKIGFLYAMCCTPKRELLYQSIFKELMIVNGNMEGMLYQPH